MSWNGTIQWGDKKKKIAAFYLVLLVVAGVLIFYFYQHNLALDKERAALKGIGTVEARKVMASFKVGGRIDKIFVEEGGQVEKGQELAVLETRELMAQLVQAQGASEAARGQAEEAESSIGLTSGTVDAVIEQAQAQLSKAEIALVTARQNYDRARALHEAGATSDKSLEDARSALDAAQKDCEAARGKLDEALAARQKIDIARNTYQAASGLSQQSEGKVQEVQAYLDNAHLKSPIAGYITQKNLEEGEMLGAGTPLFEITDLEHTYVKVFVDETKIGRVYLGQAAEVKVDSFPDRVFEGRVVWINDAGQFAVKKAISEQYSHDIRSFEVKVDVPNPDLLLKTGMTATVTMLEKE